jgi:hypothetical protein
MNSLKKPKAHSNLSFNNYSMEKEPSALQFGTNVFNESELRQYLNKEAFSKITEAIISRGPRQKSTTLFLIELTQENQSLNLTVTN